MGLLSGERDAGSGPGMTGRVKIGGNHKTMVEKGKTNCSVMPGPDPASRTPRCYKIRFWVVV